MNRRNVIRAALVLIYLAFFSWYTTFKGPMTAAEIDTAVAAMTTPETTPERLAALRSFLENDTGDDFVMLNFIQLNELEPAVAADEQPQSAEELLNRYMAYMWPALLSRACHPVLMGTAAAPALDVWGIEGAADWSLGAAMRYRSRRDMIEIASNPDFRGSHNFKFEAMAKTIAFPIDPWTSTGDPRLLLALVLMVIALLLRRSGN